MTDLTPGTEVPMSELLNDPIFRTVTPEEIRATDPFGDSKKFEVGKEINLAQLQYEIEETVGHPIQMQMHPPLDDEKAIVWISPGKDIDGRTVNGKIKSHTPDPLFGLNPEQRLRAEVAEKVRAGKVLKPEELTILLQSLIDRR